MEETQKQEEETTTVTAKPKPDTCTCIHVRELKERQYRQMRLLHTCILFVSGRMFNGDWRK